MKPDFNFNEEFGKVFSYYKEVIGAMESEIPLLSPAREEEINRKYFLMKRFWDSYNSFLLDFIHYQDNEQKKADEEPFEKLQFFKTKHDNEIKIVVGSFGPAINKIRLLASAARKQGARALPINDRIFLASHGESSSWEETLHKDLFTRGQALKNEIAIMKPEDPRGNLLSLLQYQPEAEKAKAADKFSKHYLNLGDIKANIKKDSRYSREDINEKNPDQISHIFEGSIRALPDAQLTDYDLRELSREEFKKDEDGKGRPIKDYPLKEWRKISSSEFIALLQRRLFGLVEDGMPGVKWHSENKKHSKFHKRRLGHDRNWEDPLLEQTKREKETPFYKNQPSTILAETSSDQLKLASNWDSSYNLSNPETLEIEEENDRLLVSFKKQLSPKERKMLDLLSGEKPNEISDDNWRQMKHRFIEKSKKSNFINNLKNK